jgi:hypothetical protein
MMGMYSLIEDARMKAKDAADNWHTTPEAQALLAKIDAYERQSDHWYGECRLVAGAFLDAVNELKSQIEDMRDRAVEAAADTYGDRRDDEWHEAWAIADDDAPTVAEAIQSARRTHAGDSYLESLAA